MNPSSIIALSLLTVLSLCHICLKGLRAKASSDITILYPSYLNNLIITFFTKKSSSFYYCFSIYEANFSMTSLLSPSKPRAELHFEHNIPLTLPVIWSWSIHRFLYFHILHKLLVKLHTLLQLNYNYT